MVSQIKVNEIIKQSGSSISIGESGDTINLAGATYAAAGTNTPFVLAMNSATQSLSTGTVTKITFDTEVVDTDGEFASSKWTCGTAGRYFFNCTMELQTMDNEKENWMKVYKNGGAMVPTFTLVTAKSGAAYTNVVSIMINAAASDYFEIYTVQNNGNSRNILAESAVWSIMRVIES